MKKTNYLTLLLLSALTVTACDNPFRPNSSNGQKGSSSSIDDSSLIDDSSSVEDSTSSEVSISSSEPRVYEDIPAPKIIKAHITTGEYLESDTEFTFDFADLLDENNEFKYSLARLALFLGSDFDEEWKVELYENDELVEVKETPKDITRLYRDVLGLEDIQVVDLTKRTYQYDEFDTTLILMGHKYFKKDNELYDVMFTTYDMTGGLNEWLSNADIGYDGKEYYNNFGKEHPDWLNKLNHKGFDVAANRTSEDIEGYIEQYMDKDAKHILYVNGYSRGAALSNIMAKNLIDKNLPNTKVIAYNVACPNTVATDEDTEIGYETIYNLVNETDVVARVPFKEWGFKRYGKDICFDLYKYNKLFRSTFGTRYKYVDIDENIYEDYDYNEITYVAKCRRNLYENYFNGFASYRNEEYDEGETKDKVDSDFVSLMKSVVVCTIYPLYCEVSDIEMWSPAVEEGDNPHEAFYYFDCKMGFYTIVKMLMHFIPNSDIILALMGDGEEGQTEEEIESTKTELLEKVVYEYLFCFQTFMSKCSWILTCVSETITVAYPHVPNSYLFLLDQVEPTNTIPEE